ncbi:LON peptidase substrate-binding domain-containing protein [Marivibrio halodurans]|uniref:LON peptidase substrate-binding domain-containing protein n=1 Tax=Marivibrio halodurans TaxID=2039722 RepID=A0A8J7S3P0_9PROT|nr:LON peptidase substrate-binding domain-containing protein [Marivibrio halodurans]MBP5857983.1 LON peptidase substrate-binding domain-containing protein [Marivibrio halodurans]
MSRYDPAFEDLPASIPVFPLSGVLLLPRGMLPLNIFEPRYLNMIEDALKADRMIGMIQPSATPARSDKEPPLYAMGCAGRIVAFEETDDGRFLVSLKGVARFTVAEEMPTTRGYRRVRPDWTGFETDLEEASHGAVERKKLFKSLKSFFKAQEIEASWDALNETPDERLVNSLAMICPFEASEKQALLEAPSLKERAEVLTALVEMAVLDTGGGGGDNAKQ